MGIHAIVVRLWVVVPLTQGWLSDFYGNDDVDSVDKGVRCLVG